MFYVLLSGFLTVASALMLLNDGTFDYWSFWLGFSFCCFFILVIDLIFFQKKATNKKSVTQFQDPGTGASG